MCMWQHWFRAPQQFRKRKKLPNIATLRTREQHSAKGRRWFEESTMVNEEPGEQDVGGKGMWERWGLQWLLLRRVTCPLWQEQPQTVLVAQVREQAGHARSLWKPQLIMIFLIFDHVSRRAWPGGQESITTAVSPRRKWPSVTSHRILLSSRLCLGWQCSQDTGWHWTQQMRWSSAPDHVLALPRKAETRNTGTAIQGFRISDCLVNTSGA